MSAEAETRRRLPGVTDVHVVFVVFGQRLAVLPVVAVLQKVDALLLSHLGDGEGDGSVDRQII